jgi:hypothetical protein
MHNQYVAGIEINENVFGTPRHGRDPAPDKTVREIGWKRKPQVRPSAADIEQGCADHRGRKAAAYRFDFRQFGHRIVSFGPADFRRWT